MKQHYKSFLIGIIFGGLICGGIPVLSNNLYNVTPNPYPIKINGINKQIEGYNINGNTYFKLRDIGNELDFNVSFMEDTIMISTENEIENSEGFYDFVFEKLENQLDANGNPIQFIIEYNDEKYMDLSMLSEIGWIGKLNKNIDPNGVVLNTIDFSTDGNQQLCYIKNKKTGEQLSDIEIYYIGGLGYAKYSDFENIIKPFIDSVLDENGIEK